MVSSKGMRSFKKYVTGKMTFFQSPPAISQLVILFYNLLALYHSLKTDKLWHETRKYFTYSYLRISHHIKGGSTGQKLVLIYAYANFYK